MCLSSITSFTSHPYTETHIHTYTNLSCDTGKQSSVLCSRKDLLRISTVARQSFCNKGRIPCQRSTALEATIVPLVKLNALSKRRDQLSHVQRLRRSCTSCLLHRHNVSHCAPARACATSTRTPFVCSYSFPYSSNSASYFHHSVAMGPPSGKPRQRAWKPKNRSGCKTCK